MSACLGIGKLCSAVSNWIAVTVILARLNSLILSPFLVNILQEIQRRLPPP